MEKKLLTTNEAAAYLGVSRSSLANWIRQGRISGGVTPGGHYRFTEAELDEFARSRGLEIPKKVSEGPKGPKKILVVDDDEAFCEYVRDALEAFCGYELREAHDGMEGAMTAGSWKPDLLILDIRMPSMNGTELLRLIRSNPETGGIRVLVASAHLSAERKAELEPLHPDLILDKPVHLAKLVASIQKLAELELA